MTDGGLFIVFSSKLYFTHNAVCKALQNNSSNSLMTWNNYLTLSLASCSRHQPLVEWLWKQDNLNISTTCSVKKVTVVPHFKGFSFSIYEDCCQIKLFNILSVKSMDICGHLCWKIIVLYEKKATTKTNNNVPICCIINHSNPKTCQQLGCALFQMFGNQYSNFNFKIQLSIQKYIFSSHSFSLFCHFVCLSPVNMSGIKCHMAFHIRYDAMEFPVFGQSLR